jgi:hypothetical protein
MRGVVVEEALGALQINGRQIFDENMGEFTETGEPFAAPATR